MAEPVAARDSGGRLGAGPRGRCVVPGNHDAPLIRGWALAQGQRLLAVALRVPPTASPALDRGALVAGAGARRGCSYPGVWLGDADLGDARPLPGPPSHPRLPDRRSCARRRRAVARGPRRRSTTSTCTSGSAAPREIARWPARCARPVADACCKSAADGSAPSYPELLLSTGMAPLTARLLDVQMRRAALPAMARVVERLGIDADWVVFGHVHRRGPIGDEPWPAAGAGRARPSLVNTGSWLYEPLLRGPRDAAASLLAGRRGAARGRCSRRARSACSTISAPTQLHAATALRAESSSPAEDEVAVAELVPQVARGAAPRGSSARAARPPRSRRASADVTPRARASR